MAQESVAPAGWVPVSISDGQVFWSEFRPGAEPHPHLVDEWQNDYIGGYPDGIQVYRLMPLYASTPQTVRRVRHLKRNSTYQVLGEAEAQVSKGTLAAHGRMLSEGQTLTVYRAEEDGKLWVRFPDEFEDGRYEDVP